MSYIINEGLVIKKTSATHTLSDGTNQTSIVTPTLSTNSNFILPITAGATDNILKWGASNILQWEDESGNRTFWTVCDIKSSGTDGGSFIAGAWRTRDLNTLSKPSGTGTEVQLAVSPATTNQLRIDTGTYRIFGHVPCRSGGLTVQNLHKAKLRNISDSVDVLIGTSERNVNASNNSYISGIFTVSSGPKVYEIQHQTSTDRTGDGFGVATNISGVDEVYTCLYIEKVSD